MLTAPNPEQMAKATEHLRYWPYVKAFRKFGSHSVELVVNVGIAPESSSITRMMNRSMDLIHLCLRQYGIRVSDSWLAELDYRPSFTPDLFLRPDDNLRPFSEFIDELDSDSKKYNHSKLQ